MPRCHFELVTHNVSVCVDVCMCVYCWFLCGDGEIATLKLKVWCVGVLVKISDYIFLNLLTLYFFAFIREEAKSLCEKNLPHFYAPSPSIVECNCPNSIGY